MKIESYRAFTLIELLVVITIIVVLLALLVPSMDKAIYAAEKLQCLTNQRAIVQAAVFYGNDNRRVLPVYAMPGRGWTSAYDIRTLVDDNGNAQPVQRFPLGLGLLPANGYTPEGPQLANMYHCPVMDNTGTPVSIEGQGFVTYEGAGMDRQHELSYGCSWWSDPDPVVQSSRIVMGYNYRATSYAKQGKGDLRLGRLPSNTVLVADMPDQRITGMSRITTVDEDYRRFTHFDGYGRVFVDGHSAFYDDLDYDLARTIYSETGGWGTVDGYQQNNENAGRIDERIYGDFLNRQ